MERQDVKAWLERYIICKSEKRRIEDSLKQLRIDSDGIKAQVLTGMPSGSKKAISVQERAILKMSDIERRWMLKCNESAITMSEIETAILSIADAYQREILWYRYIDDLHWESILKKVHYERTWANEIHNRGLDAVAEYLKCEHH